jgi:hypothetical protein
MTIALLAARMPAMITAVSPAAKSSTSTIPPTIGYAIGRAVIASTSTSSTGAGMPRPGRVRGIRRAGRTACDR